MKGIPNVIQTPADLNNLFAMARRSDSGQVNAPAVKNAQSASLSLAEAEFSQTRSIPEQSQIDKNELAERIRRLIGTQYHRVPIIAASGKAVTTRYFPEVSKGSAIEGGLTVTKFEHIEGEQEDGADGGDGANYETTVITLSAVPTDDKVLSVYRPDNPLTRGGFDVGEMNKMLEVLIDA